MPAGNAGGGTYFLDTGDGLFSTTATLLASLIRDGSSLSGAQFDAVPIRAVAGTTEFPVVTAQVGTAFASTLAQLTCVDADFAAATATPPSDDPFADVPPSEPSATAPSALPADGDAFATLLEAGGEVRLPAGEFALPYDVTPVDDLRLIGAGLESTTLFMSAIEVSGLTAADIDLTVQGMTIVVDMPVRGGLGFGDAISSYGGDLILRDLAIFNVADHGDTSVSGVSLVSGTLSATDLIVDGFPFAGIYVEGGVANLRDVTLSFNRNGLRVEGFETLPYAEVRDGRLVDNELAGIAVFSDASALVKGGTIAHNGSEAAFVAGSGSLTLEDLDIENHASYGVVAEGGRAVLRNVTLTDNANAIWALLDSTVTVERSDILASRDFAVAGNGTGTTTLRNVTIDGSDLSGVHAEEARIVVVENSAIRNAGESGVNLLADSRGEIRTSRIESSNINGIEARGSAHVTVVDTVLVGNGQFGLLVDDGASHDLRGVTYEANGAGSFQLPGASAAAPDAAETPAPQPSRTSRRGANSASTDTPATPSTPSTPAPSGASGTWQLGDQAGVLTYQAGARAFGFVCNAGPDTPPVVYLQLPDVSVSSSADDIASFEFARANGTLGTVSWNFLDLGDGLFVTDDVATDDIVDKLIPDQDSTQWNTVVVGVPGQGGVLSVSGEPLVADLFLQLACIQ